MTNNNITTEADAEFAEIEYGFTREAGMPGRVEPLILPAGIIEAPETLRPRDPIRQRFFEMRSVSPVNTYFRDDNAVFYKQAKLMEDFEDDYAGDAKFFMYFPYYRHMGYEQLRTYFTWRTGVRRGEITATSLSYVFLYIYELLAGIGVDNPEDGLEKLIKLWFSYRKFGPALERYLPGWIRDYHVYYGDELARDFSEFVCENGLQTYFPEQFLFDQNAGERLLLWNSLSRYDITKSAFRNGGREASFAGCFDAVFRGINEYCAVFGLSLEDLFIYDLSNYVAWRPFKQALFFGRRRSDRKVKLPGRESYRCKNGRWTASLPLRYADRSIFAEYVLRKTEICIRRFYKHRYMIKADSHAALRYFRDLRKRGVTIEGIDSAIEKSAAGFFRNSTRITVAVNSADLDRIREKSSETQTLLTVPEDGLSSQALPPEPFADAVEADIGRQAPGGWPALKKALSKAELEALKIALFGDGRLSALAAEYGEMPEILVSGINEKAADLTGDNIAEFSDGDITVYDEYREIIAEMIG